MMSSQGGDYLLKDNFRTYPSKSRARKYIWLTVFFLLGAFVVFIPAAIILSHKSDCRNTSPAPSSTSTATTTATATETTTATITTTATATETTTATITATITATTTTGPSSWNGSDYLSNSDYYNELPEQHDFTQLDNLRLDRLSSPRLHPTTGQTVIYLRTQYHMPDLKGSTSTLHWLNLQTNKTVQLTRPIWGIYDQQFYWVNNSTVLFLSNRASSGRTQLFQLNLPADGSDPQNYTEPVQITDYSLDIDNLLVNRQGTRLAFSCQVYANLSIQETADRQAMEATSGSLVYKFDKLFIRHWDEYMLGRRHHPFVVSIAQDANGIYNFTSTPKDVLFGIDSDSPTRPFGDGRTQWSFSASGNQFAFTRQHDETSAVAWSTNLDIYTVDVTKADWPLVCITCDNLAADTDPKYSPTEENVLVYRAQSVPGYESDRFKIKLYNGSENITLLEGHDFSIQALTWSADGQILYLEFGFEAANVIYQFSNIYSPTSLPVECTFNGSSHDVNVHPTNTDIFVYTHESITEPTNIYIYQSSTLMRPLTDHNTNLMNKVRISTTVDKFSFVGALNETVYGWHVSPVNGTTDKAPLAFLIHGGPQSSWYDAWSYRWNYEVFAGRGFAVVAINFHGSDSYGQNFTDSITGNYGTLPYEDLKAGLTAALQQYSYIDPNRGAALGASYGGYMINWIAGHPELSQRFRTLVCHDGLFDMRGMAYSTEELWFSEHDAGNFTPYDNPEAFEEFNPVNHVINWTQPMLIIHGGRDYRVPDTQGIGAFTALQRRGIPSRMLFLPNENHWTLNPFNSLIWYQEVLDWIENYTKPT